MIRLVDDEQIRDLQQARLDRLDVVSLPRSEDDEHRVGHPHDVNLVLPHADRLDEDRVAARGVHQVDGVAGGATQASRTASARHRTNEHGGIEGVLLHPNPVTQDRPAAEAAARVDGDHSHVPPTGAERPVCWKTAARTCSPAAVPSSTSEIARARAAASPEAIDAARASVTTPAPRRRRGAVSRSRASGSPRFPRRWS